MTDTFKDQLLHGMTIRESASDGSDFTNPAADYRRLFLGEDGLLHLRDSAGTVTDIGAGDAAGISFDPTGLAIVTGMDVQTAIEELDAAVDAAGLTAPVGDKVVRTAGDISTSSTTYVDATGLTITKTTGAHRVMVGLVASIYNTNTGGHVALTYAVDGSDAPETFFVSQHSTGSEGSNGSAVWLTDVLSAGSHTIKARVRAVSAGNAVIQANASQSALFWIAETLIAA